MRKPNRWLSGGLAASPAQRLTREWKPSAPTIQRAGTMSPATETPSGAMPRTAAVDESNAAEGLARRTVPLNAETAQRGQTIGHQPFAACFVDRRTRAVRECHVHSLKARGDGGREASGAASDYE